MEKTAALFFVSLAFTGCGVGAQENPSGGIEEQTQKAQREPVGSSVALPQDGKIPNGNVDTGLPIPQASTQPQRNSSGLSSLALAFELPIRTIDSPEKKLWATWYRTPRFANLETGFDLLDMNGLPLGPKLSHRQWCDAAMEGSVQVLMAG
ncbi:MAG: hypothetical protein ACO3A4_14985, partial [Silvanigrellaceae bacterium]